MKLASLTSVSLVLAGILRRSEEREKRENIHITMIREDYHQEDQVEDLLHQGVIQDSSRAGQAGDKVPEDSGMIQTLMQISSVMVDHRDLPPLTRTSTRIHTTHTPTNTRSNNNSSITLIILNNSLHHLHTVNSVLIENNHDPR